MIKGFRDFVMRGNVVDLAIAVVIGTAFTAVVNAVVNSIIQPILNALPGVSANGLTWSIRGTDPRPPSTSRRSSARSSRS